MDADWIKFLNLKATIESAENKADLEAKYLAIRHTIKLNERHVAKLNEIADAKCEALAFSEGQRKALRSVSNQPNVQRVLPFRGV